MTSSIAIVIGPTPPGTGVIADATSSGRLEVDVAAESVLGSVHADVDDHRARLDRIGAEQFGDPDRGDQDVGAAADGVEVAGAGVTDGDRRVRGEQESSHRHPD